MRLPAAFAALLAAACVCCVSACTPANWGPSSCVFSSHMVLASSDKWAAGVTPARVWGTAAPGEKITLSGLPDGAVVKPSNPWSADASGNWSITVSVASSLTPVNLTFTGDSKNVIIEDVLFGHTFLCSGQSNMDMDVACTFTANETAVLALQYPEIRLMDPGAAGIWYSAGSPANNAFMEDFSATCYFTALNLKLYVPAFKDVPIGLVQSSVGGQVIERFMSASAMESVGVPTINATFMSCGQSSHTLYDSLIFPLAPFVFKAMIWYQGEANVNCNFVKSPAWEVDYYSRLLPAMVSSWRELFNVDFVALVVQLAAYAGLDPYDPERTYDGLPALREAQLSVLSLPLSGVATAIDIGDDGYSIWTPPSCSRHGGIHPRNKTEVGRRLALRLAEIEGVLPPSSLASGPIPTSFSSSATAVTIVFDANSAQGLSLTPTADCRTVGRIPPPQNATTAFCCQSAIGDVTFGYPFELRLVDGSFQLAVAVVNAPTNTVVLTPLNSSVVGPFTGVRYAWQGFPLCTVSNSQSLPTGPFFEEF